MAATVEIEPFVTSLRERLAMKLENHMNVPDVLAAFDRATVEAVFSSLNGKREKELTPQQRAGLTKRRNNELKRAMEAAKGGDSTSPVSVGV